MKKISALFIALFLLSGGQAFAAGDAAVATLSQSMDTIWVMIAAFLVFFMHAGFAMVETGFTRSKNALNILMKNLLTMSIGAVLYFIIGYGIMFGTSSGGFIGTNGFFLLGQSENIGFFVFQAVFAATCATIISGAVAERMKLISYIAVTIAMVAIVYPVVGHWIWGGGWLSELGFTDFAGSTVVHLTGAIGAVVAVSFLGGRIGKYSNGKVNVIQGHNIPLGALGVFILWFGWFGFNAGSTLSASDALIPIIVATTLLSASGGVIGSALYSYIRYKQIDASLTLNGALAGLVGITAGTASVSPIGAIFIGLIAGVILIEAVQLIDRRVKLDDPVGAIAVHGVCGVWGTVAVGLFAVEGGLFYEGGAALLLVQVIGVLAVIAWTSVTLGTFLFIYTRFSSIRVSREEEIQGLDFAEHGSTAYELRGGILNNNETPSSGSPFGHGLVDRLNRLEKPKADRKAEVGG
ncbi:ammonium transporter [Guptibacillus hwajinpoensis]|uniref:Ammonium transporter n=1 Tax=Guptibacillus hwajinpoensis TaxID=208199 RepID=A0ABU0K292_9BACL|nr:ammonium transporter [Alkalihalobacillus hemicentroti]MDQ0483478.1 Amt family ammonium transporter [Alkalihalobacillus hemicentroti]